MEPSVLLFCPLHLAVKFIEEPVAEKLVVWKVELAASVVEAVVVAFAWEIEPLGVAKLVAFEVQVALTSQAVRDQTDQLM